MKKQVEKLVVLLGVAGAFVLMSFIMDIVNVIRGGLVIDVNLMKMICR